ncbi:MAG: carboxy terminal-processing peptidase [Chitinispirillaceae bacterium]|nr:carboxy terminal-processing peptidase [Chitinispirillaceae bacterium]
MRRFVLALGMTVASILPSSVWATKKNAVGEQALMIIKTTEKYHYAPKPVDDNFSRSVFSLFMCMLDPAGTIFTRDIFEKLARFATVLDDQIKNRRTDALDSIVMRYIDQLNVVEQLLRKMEQYEFDFSGNDTLWLGGLDEFEKTDDLKKKWEQLIKFMVLWTFHNQNDSTDTSVLPEKDELWKIVKDVVAREQCKLRLKLATPGGVKQTAGEFYLKAIATAFDPHSAYMSPVEKERFESDLSKYAGSFGMSIAMNLLGEVEVEELVPGGPAWYSNAINEGDVLLEVMGSDKTVNSFRCVTLARVEKILDGYGNERVLFIIRKKNGKVVTVALRKEYLDVEDNIIRSYLLQGKRKFGYLYLPSFYTDFSYLNFASTGCANDLAKELIKLKRDSIQGLIIDIRSNGGGSMHEALRTAGVFIDKGTLCIDHSRDEKPRLIKDEARGSIFDGPLVVLVNSYSASASELFAGVLQDYSRAVIVGSVTFGKSSMQVLLPVDAAKFETLENYKGTPPGFLKITTGAFYRVTGDSHQKKGVRPDILLPDMFEGALSGEASYKNALEFDSIKKKTYYYPSDPLPLADLRASSKMRVGKTRGFSYAEKISRFIPKLNTRYCIPLNAELFAGYTAAIENAEDSLSVENRQFSITVPGFSGKKKKRNKAIEEDNVSNSIQKDIYIIEAYNILQDLSVSGSKGSK